MPLVLPFFLAKKKMLCARMLEQTKRNRNTEHFKILSHVPHAYLATVGTRSLPYCSAREAVASMPALAWFWSCELKRLITILKEKCSD